MVTKKQVRDELRKGGERIFQKTAAAEVYDVKGPKRERASAAGQVTLVRQLLDPRLKLTPRQRAVGTCFGAYVEMSLAGSGNEFLREYVDSTKGVSQGVSEAAAHRVMMVQCALDAMKNTHPFSYPYGKGRGRNVLGRHKPIKPFTLAWEICVKGRNLTYLAVTHGWVRQKKLGNGRLGRPIVPDRQRKKLAEHFKSTLDLIDRAWTDAGYEVPYDLSTVETE